jgi:hypothetical protein
MRKTVVVLEDDLDGSEASETLNFSVDGAEYEIDLNADHANELRSALSRYTNVARKVTSGRGRPAARKSSGAGTDAKAIRMWAIDNGLQVNTRGRIQADIVEKYLAALAALDVRSGSEFKWIRA